MAARTLPRAQGGSRSARIVAAAITGATLASASFAAEPGPPQIELSATVSGRAVNDQMVVQLTAERSGTDIGALNAQVLQALRTGLDAAAKVDGVKGRSGSVTTQPVWDKDGKRTSWRVAGTLILEGTDLVATGELAGRLSKSLQLANVEYRLTPAQRAQAENRLIDEVAVAFRERARRATLALGFRDYDLDKVAIQTQGSAPPSLPRAMRMAAEAAVAVPPDGGEATVDVTMSGTIRVR